jgi:hypothetical protein
MNLRVDQSEVAGTLAGTLDNTGLKINHRIARCAASAGFEGSN